MLGKSRATGTVETIVVIIFFFMAFIATFFKIQEHTTRLLTTCGMAFDITKSSLWNLHLK